MVCADKNIQVKNEVCLLAEHLALSSPYVHVFGTNEVKR